MNHRKWVIELIIVLVSTMVIWIGVTVAVDPYFHYHKPIEGLSYRLIYERFMNDGIARNFSYDAIITGTSMTQNFIPSHMDELYQVRTIKAPFQGAGYEEISNYLERAFTYQNGIKRVLWGIDINGLIKEPGWANYEAYPDYLYDDNPFNDIAYTLDKTTMYQGVLNTLLYTIQGGETTSMDEYSILEQELGYGYDEEEILDTERIDRPKSRPMSKEELDHVITNIELYVIPLLEENPNTEFMLFYPPYSMGYWNRVSIDGEIDVMFQALEEASKRILEYPNASLYYYGNQYEFIGDKSQYSDYLHYGSHINTWILESMQDGVGQLTIDNYQALLEVDRIYYNEYDYVQFMRE